jgi:hypothetical protein
MPRAAQAFTSTGSVPVAATATSFSRGSRAMASAGSLTLFRTTKVASAQRSATWSGSVR